jgi:PPIC-type PPIASE domain
VRRVLVLVVVAAAIAVGAGLAIPSSAVTVNGEAISQSQLNDELAAITASPSYQCFLESQAFLNGLSAPSPVHGVSTPTWFSTATVEWSNTRTTDLAIVQYVRAHDPAAFNDLAAARTDLEGAIQETIQAASSQGAATHTKGFCAGLPTAPTGAETLASMPTWFQNDQVEANAAELGLQSLITAPLPTQGAALETWFEGHADSFETTCISYIVTPDLPTAEAVAARIERGLSFAEAAKRYSKDTSTAGKGGVLGCYAPSSPQWATVQHYVGNVRTGNVSAPLPYPNSPDYLLFTATKRTPNSFADVRTAVASANEAANRTSAELLAVQIQRAADVTVSPAIGSWLSSPSGGTIVPPVAPPPSSVTNAAANTPAA